MENVYKIPDSDLVNKIDKEEYQPKVFSMSGRIGRLRYLAYSFLFNILTVVAIIILMFFASLLFNFIEVDVAVDRVAGLVAMVMLTAAYFVLAKRRLNDLNKSGWLSLVGLIPIINIFFILYVFFWPGTDERNDYGAKPCENSSLIIFGTVLVPILFIVIMAAISVTR